jgi:hypothetical protein
MQNDRIKGHVATDFGRTADIFGMPPCRLRIVVFPETRRTWTARALEHDLAAQGWSVESALDTLVRLIQAHVAFDRRHNRKPLSAFAAAPRVYWTAFNRAAELPIQMELDWQGTDTPSRIVAAMLSDHPAIRRSSVARIA